jgi:phospholipid/cholesterol/gamma-HCH transport system substrate-binding protein
MVIVVSIGAVGGMLWLRGRSIGKPDAAIIYADIGNLKEGAPVRISGAPVGRVVDIVYQGVGKVAIGIKFDVPIPMTTKATASITGVGMLGDMVITLDPGNGSPRLVTDTIHGTMTAGIFDKAGGLADSAAITLNKLNTMLDVRLIDDLRKTLASSQKLMAHLADQKDGPMSQISPTMLGLQRTNARLDSTLGQLDVKKLQSRLDSTMKSAGSATDRLAAMAARADTLMGKIARGEGTLGKFMTDTTLYVDLRKTMQSMSQLLDEIKKNPGKIGVTVKIL